MESMGARFLGIIKLKIRWDLSSFAGWQLLSFFFVFSSSLQLLVIKSIEMCCLAVEPDKGLIKTDAIFLIRHLEEHDCVFLMMPAEINLSFLKDLDVL